MPLLGHNLGGVIAVGNARVRVNDGGGNLIKGAPLAPAVQGGTKVHAHAPDLVAHVTARNGHLATGSISLEGDHLFDIEFDDLRAIDGNLVVLVTLELIGLLVEALHQTSEFLPDVAAAVVQPPHGELFGVLRATFSNIDHGECRLLGRDEAQSGKRVLALAQW